MILILIVAMWNEVDSIGDHDELFFFPSAIWDEMGCFLYDAIFEAWVKGGKFGIDLR